MIEEIGNKQELIKIIKSLHIPKNDKLKMTLSYKLGGLTDNE